MCITPSLFPQLFFSGLSEPLRPLISLFPPCSMALIFPQDQFQHILRILNTNVDGRHKVPFAMTAIKGVGRRFANMVCKKAEVNLNKR